MVYPILFSLIDIDKTHPLKNYNNDQENYDDDNDDGE